MRIKTGSYSSNCFLLRRLERSHERKTAPTKRITFVLKYK